MYLFSLVFIFNLVECTVDINLAELEYIANQLTPVECEKLDDYLHSHLYEVTLKNINFFSFGERSCLEILVHWNSSPHEGYGETHTILAHRLSQIGRKDLAEWLSSTVFKRLSMKLKESVLANPFKDLRAETTVAIEAEASGNNSDLSFNRGEAEWETYDTLAVVVAICLLSAVVILIYELSGCSKSLQKKKKVKNIRNKKYSLLPLEEGPSSDEGNKL